MIIGMESVPELKFNLAQSQAPDQVKWNVGTLEVMTTSRRD